jgi:hypothetical protein
MAELGRYPEGHSELEGEIWYSLRQISEQLRLIVLYSQEGIVTRAKYRRIFVIMNFRIQCEKVETLTWRN